MIHPLDPTTFFVSFVFWVVRLGEVGVFCYPTGTVGLSVMEGGGCNGEPRLNGHNGSLSVIYPIDITTKSFDSQLVLESIARSKSEVHSNGVYGVTFDLIKILKGSAPGLLKRKQLRLQFLVDQSPPNKTITTAIHNIDLPIIQQPRRLPPLCLPKVNVKTGRKYYVFINKVGNNQFIPFFTPELINKRNTRRVKSILCDDCSKSPLLVSVVKSVVLEPEGQRLRLHCNLISGNPIPNIQWYKNDQLINFNTNNHYRLRIKRRQSILVIQNASEMDAGLYRCQVQNSLGISSDLIRIIGVPNPVKNPASTLRPDEIIPCSHDMYEYCENGGTCRYLVKIKEYACMCAEGYKRERCSEKEAPSSLFTSDVYRELLPKHLHPL